MFSELFTPQKIGNCTIKNRLVVPAMVVNVCNTDGTLTDRFIKYHEEKAKGGWGLIITEDYGVTAEGKGYDRIPGFYNDDQILRNQEFTDVIHNYGTKVFCQIYHAGKQKMANVEGTAIAPSAIKDPLAMNMPREITVEEIDGIVKAFGAAAKRAQIAGFDGVEIHAAHGYLIAQFLSHFINKRTDEYGGCFNNRVRFFDEIYTEVRKNVGYDYPVIVRMSVNEYVTGGRTEAESYALARHFDEIGVDAIHVSNGVYASDPEHHTISNMFADNAFNTDAAKQIKELVSCPIITVNKIHDPIIADTMIKMGKADFIAMGRPSLADPYLPNKTKDGKFDEINNCIACLQGCEEGVLTGKVGCLVNPRCVNEVENDLSKVESSKKVMVIGAGPAGLMAARTAAQRGHKVTIFDKDSHFGGAFRAAGYPMGKGHLSGVISSYRQQCINLGVEIKMGLEVTDEIIKSEKPEAIVIATGSRPLTPQIFGIDGTNVLTAEDVLYGISDVKSGPVIVCGGGEVGGETAEFIAQTNRDVTLIEMRSQILSDMFPVNMISLIQHIHQLGIKIITNATVTAIGENCVTYKDSTGTAVTIPSETVVSAFGYKAYNPLEDVAKENCEEVYVVGSAVKAGNALVAIQEGYQAGLKL
ncbi:FAD-dependent oxidoreductase [Alkalibacter mobilis]|uniref:FAD-dependent oxidoreductase n=1 Tax=Alkalibacter mobilis TaxID=2787712 RepID=UPI00189E44C8|nr:FAD-dependent oxidoreductase [Alkalibacter mobilis]MBF7097670.1 FAD-dependent oxidoreductase [Alkalibacter mobilis]